MNISFSQDFLTDLERIDNVVEMTTCEINSRTYQTHTVCHGNIMKVCIVGVEEESCTRLDFYYNGGLAYTITDGSIVLNQNRTLFEITLPSTPKAIISCPYLTNDTKFLESIGVEYGQSLYKDVKALDDSLVWKKSLGKYVVDRGLNEEHFYDVELLDTKSGCLENRPIRFKSYQNIIIEPGNWPVSMIKEEKTVEHDVYSTITDSLFLVWDSPMIDAKINLEAEPDCINNLGEFLNPKEVVYGNTDCYQFINFQSGFRGLKIYGTEGSEIEVMFNRESVDGKYSSFLGKIDSSGEVEIMITDLPFYHFNGIIANGPCKIQKIESINFQEEVIDVYIHDPRNIYEVSVKNERSVVKINGYCEYIEYEKYLGVIKEIGRGVESINSISSIIIETINEGPSFLPFTRDNQGKQIRIYKSTSLNTGITLSKSFQLSIKNNLQVNGNLIETKELISDYKIRIEQSGIVWKIKSIPDFINEEDGNGIYLLNYEEGSARNIRLLTNLGIDNIQVYSSMDSIVSSIFDITEVEKGEEIIDGESWYYFDIQLSTKSENTENKWRPKDTNENPYKITLRAKQGITEINTDLYIYAIQLRKIEPKMEIWEEIAPGKYSEADNTIELHNTTVKSFVVVEKVEDPSSIVEGQVWYTYDIYGLDKFYVTDYNLKETNVGEVYYVSEDTEVLSLGTGDLRTKFSRLLTVNKSDITGYIGPLIVTNLNEYPDSWKSMVDNNLDNAEVVREITNTYIQVGTEGDEEHMLNEDLEIDINCISKFSLFIRSNSKYFIKTSGYFKLFKEDEEHNYLPASEYPTETEILSEYSEITEIHFVLTGLDESNERQNTYIGISAGNTIRRVSLKDVEPRKEHDYVFEYPNPDLPDEESEEEYEPIIEVEKPNLIRIYENGALIPMVSNTVFYKSSTTPSFDYVNVEKISETTDLFFKDSYLYHKSTIVASIQNSRALSYSKYPMKSFGSINEVSRSYSEGETVEIDGEREISPLEYPLYMKGKNHFLWGVKTLDNFLNVQEPEIPEVEEGETPIINTNIDLFLDTAGSGGNVYIVSRYDIDNNTFQTKHPSGDEVVIERNNLKATIILSPQQKINLDETTQIEYAIPISISSNIPNEGGNVFLGSLEYKAITKVSEDPFYVGEIIDASKNIIESEGIDPEYVKNNILKEFQQNLFIRVFQEGASNRTMGIISHPSDLGVDEVTEYIVPEVGNDFILTNLNYTVTSDQPEYEQPLEVSSEWSPRYFLITIHNQGLPTGSQWVDVGDGLPDEIIQDIHYEIEIETTYEFVGEEGVSYESTYTERFTRYGFNYGFYIDHVLDEGSGTYTGTYAGFGNLKNYDPSLETAEAYVPAAGGFISIHAGVFYAVDGINNTEALMVPKEYKFISENKPLEISWEDSNMDASGNLTVVFPPRIRDEYGKKEYVLQITQPHEYYPLNLYIKFIQDTFYVEENGEQVPDTGMENYKLMFRKENINVYSNGTIEGGDDKLYFVHNIIEDDFNKVSFDWVLKNGDPIPSVPDDLSIEELERSYKEGYVKFKFKPNGSGIFLDAKIRAFFKKPDGNKVEIGSVGVKQGYYCLGLKPESPQFLPMMLVENLLSRQISKPILTASVRETVLVAPVPCKSYNDNSDTSLGTYRCVFQLRARRKEFNYDSEVVYSSDEPSSSGYFGNIFKEITVLGYSSEYAFESCDARVLIVTSNGSQDNKDAKASLKFYPDYGGYISNQNYGDYNPYAEIVYVVKDEYLRESVPFNVSCKIQITEIETGNPIDFYFLASYLKEASNEPENPDSFELSETKLKFGYEKSTKQVSYHPESFTIDVSKIPENADWFSIETSENSNIILVSVEDNKTTKEEGSDPVPSFYRTAQIKLDLIDTRTRNRDIIRTDYIDVEQEPDYAIVGDPDQVQRVIMETPVEVRADMDNPLYVTTDASFDVCITNDSPIPVEVSNQNPISVSGNVGITGQPISVTGNVGITGQPISVSGNVGITGQPISVTGTVQASNIPTDYARQSDIPTDYAKVSDIPTDYATSSELSDAKADIIDEIDNIPTCRYNPPT